MAREAKFFGAEFRLNWPMGMEFLALSSNELAPDFNLLAGDSNELAHFCKLEKNVSSLPPKVSGDGSR